MTTLVSVHNEAALKLLGYNDLVEIYAEECLRLADRARHKGTWLGMGEFIVLNGTVVVGMTSGMVVRRMLKNVDS